MLTLSSIDALSKGIEKMMLLPDLHELHDNSFFPSYTINNLLSENKMVPFVFDHLMLKSLIDIYAQMGVIQNSQNINEIADINYSNEMLLSQTSAFSSMMVKATKSFKFLSEKGLLPNNYTPFIISHASSYSPKTAYEDFSKKYPVVKLYPLKGDAFNNFQFSIILHQFFNKLIDSYNHELFKELLSANKNIKEVYVFAGAEHLRVFSPTFNEKDLLHGFNNYDFAIKTELPPSHITYPFEDHNVSLHVFPDVHTDNRSYKQFKKFIKNEKIKLRVPNKKESKDLLSKQICSKKLGFKFSQEDLYFILCKFKNHNLKDIQSCVETSLTKNGCGDYIVINDPFWKDVMLGFCHKEPIGMHDEL